jgi:hypothetical protein
MQPAAGASMQVTAAALGWSSVSLSVNRRMAQIADGAEDGLP